TRPGTRAFARARCRRHAGAVADGNAHDLAGRAAGDVQPRALRARRPRCSRRRLARPACRWSPDAGHRRSVVHGRCPGAATAVAAPAAGGARMKRVRSKRWRRLRFRLLLRHAVLVVVLLAAGALMFVAAGMAPVAADAGHWPVTRVLLHSAMSRAVEVRAMKLQAPPLDDLALLQKGAGHYATACMDCHGAPGVPRRHFVRQMTPTPPFLPEKLGRMTPEELFWVVDHGIKYTAMPAWGARGRGDEVWAVVAFLEQIEG